MFVVAPQAAQVLNKNYGRSRPARKQKESGVSSSCFNSGRPTRVFVLKFGQSAGQQQARVGRLEFRLQLTSPDESCLLSLGGRWVRPPTLLLPAASPATRPPGKANLNQTRFGRLESCRCPIGPARAGEPAREVGISLIAGEKNSCRRTQVQNKKKDPTPSVMSAGSITPGQANTPGCGFKTDSRQFWGWTVCTIWKLSEYRAW